MGVAKVAARLRWMAPTSACECEQAQGDSLELRVNHMKRERVRLQAQIDELNTIGRAAVEADEEEDQCL